VLDQVASLSAGGVMVLQAGRDVTLQATQLTQGGTDSADSADSTSTSTSTGADGGILIQAGQNLTLSTVQTSSSEDWVKNANNYKKQSQSQDVGTEIVAEGAIVLKAGQDLTATAATISSESGGITLAAGRDVQLLAGEANEVIEEMSQKTKKSLFKKKITTTYSKTDETTALGTTVSGETVDILAGQDIGLVGASVVSDLGTTLQAGRDISIVGATNELESEQFKQTKKSGLMSGGGIGITIGKQSLAQTTTTSTLSNAASTVASVSGDVTLVAGGAYQQVGSDVSAPGGDVSITAASIAITEAREQAGQDTETRFKQSGLSVSLSSPVISAVTTAAQMGSAATKTSDPRMQALAAAQAALSVKDAVGAVQAVAQNPSAGVGINISLGASKSTSAQTQTSQTAAASTVTAGGTVDIQAAGSGAESGVLVRGSDIQAGGQVTLKAEGAIELQAAQNTSEQHSKNSGSSGSIGIGINFGGSQNGISLNASASQSRGHADGVDTSWSNTHVSGQTVSLQSGGDTTLQGAVVSGQQISAVIGGDLSIESLQDTSSYSAKQQSAGVGVSLCLPPLCAGASSVSANANKTKANGDYASVTEQSGINAGDGGFQIDVKGATTLTGATIASTQAAIDAGKNSLTTAALVTQDLKNVAEANASSSGVSLDTDMLSQGKYGLAKGVIGNALNNGSASGASSGTSYSAISAGTVSITDEGKQQVLTGQTAAETVTRLNRDTVNAQTAAQKQNVHALLETAQAEQAIKQTTFKQVTIHTDAAYTALFKNKPNFYKVTCSSSTQDCMNDPSKVTMQSIKQDEAKQNGSILAVNGIMNEAERAGQLAYQNAPVDGNNQKPETIVLMHIAPASTGLGDIMVAGYEKLLAPTLGYSNADITYADALQGRGNEQTLSLGHSRGTIVQTNALNIAADNGYTNDQLSVIGVGGAVKGQTYVDAATRVTQTEGSATFIYMPNDPVPVIAAGNPGDAWAAFKEFANLSNSNSAHSCYGTGATGCVNIANPVVGGPAPKNQQSQNVITYRGDVIAPPQGGK
jgi:filamentous hemagglutinin